MSKAQICISLTVDNLKEFLENLKEAQPKADILELKIDSIKNLEIQDLLKIKQNLEKPAIFSFNTFEAIDNPEAPKLFLEKALELEFEYIKVNLTDCLADSTYFKNLISPKIEKKNSKNNKNKTPKIERKTQFIISYTHFTDTPSYLKLRKIKKQMAGFHVNIFQFSTFIKSQQDNQILAKLLLNKKSSEKMIVAGAGKVGQITRIIFPFLGNFLAFTALPNPDSSSDQSELDKLKEILEKLV